MKQQRNINSDSFNPEVTALVNFMLTNNAYNVRKVLYEFGGYVPQNDKDLALSLYKLLTNSNKELRVKALRRAMYFHPHKNLIIGSLEANELKKHFDEDSLDLAKNGKTDLDEKDKSIFTQQYYPINNLQNPYNALNLSEYSIPRNFDERYISAIQSGVAGFGGNGFLNTNVNKTDKDSSFKVLIILALIILAISYLKK